jgi:hypothetical protein
MATVTGCCRSFGIRRSAVNRPPPPRHQASVLVLNSLRFSRVFAVFLRFPFAWLVANVQAVCEVRERKPRRTQMGPCDQGNRLNECHRRREANKDSLTTDRTDAHRFRCEFKRQSLQLTAGSNRPARKKRNPCVSVRSVVKNSSFCLVLPRHATIRITIPVQAIASRAMEAVVP